MDLGISQGIRSVGTFLNSSLACISPAGAALKISLAGNLEMTSSQIASYNGGSITLKAQGHLNIGSQEQFTSDDTPKGIYTGNGGSVDVESVGDINVNGSRIATYDGGDVKVVSSGGSIDAGAGAKGFFEVATQEVKPPCNVVPRTDKFFGSGIVALTRSDSGSQVGNISVAAGKDILANSGGILELAFNHSDLSLATVTLEAGRNIEANQSGVLGANVKLHAIGDITGLVVANQTVNIGAAGNVSVSALGGGAVTVSGATVSGNIVGGGNVSVSGSEVSASVISVGGTASGGNAAGAFSGVAAPVAQQTTTDAEKKVVAKATDTEDDEEKNKRAAKGPVLSKTTGRVTVILPNKP